MAEADAGGARAGASLEVYAFDPETLRIRFANQAACLNSGYTREELTGLTPLELEPELSSEALRAMLEPLRAGDRPARAFETRHRRKDGSEYPVEVHLQLVDFAPGGAFVAIVDDVTERRRVETRLRHLNRVYAFLSDVNQAIVRVREPKALFAEACRVAVETGGFRMAWVGLLDAATSRVRPVAAAGWTDGYLDGLEAGAAGGGARAPEPAASAVREGRREVFNDVARDPRTAAWRGEALARGYRAAAALPLAVGGQVLGVFTLYAGVPGVFDDEELCLLDELALDLSFAMERARLEGVGLRLATAIEQSPVSVMITDVDGRIEYVNPAFTRITGYASAEALGQNPRMLKSGKQEPELYRQLWATIRAGTSWHGELVNLRKDGGLYTQELTIAPVRDAAGAFAHFVAISQDVTERKRDEQALRMARFALDHAADMILWVDRDARLVYANDTAPRLLGYSRQELLGLRLWQVAVGLSPEAWPAAWEAARQAGSLVFEDRSRRRDGSSFPVEVVVTHLTLGDTELRCSVVRDISARRRTEEDLRNAEARYRVLFEQSPDGVLLIEPETGKTLEANEAASRQLGYTREEFAELRLSDYEARERPEETRRHVQRVLAHGSDDFETRHRTRHGAIRDVHVWAKALQLGERTAIYCIFEDVTERRQAEAALRDSEARLRRIVDNIHDALYVDDAAGRVVFANEQFLALFGVQRAQLARLALEDYVAPEWRATLRDRHERRLRGEPVPSRFEYEGLRQDGARLWVETTVVPLLDESGRVIGTQAADRDITERKRLEAQLLQSQKIEAIGQLAGGVAHDFNNIVAVITAYGELAQRELGAEHPVRPRVDQMLKAAERAAGLTRQLLAFSRKQVMRPRLLDLHAVVADMQKLLGRLIGEDIRLVIQAVPDLGTVNADPGQIEQIVLNLALNARDAMPKGGSLILGTANVDLDEDYCAAHPPAAPGRYVMLAVSDTGVGMDRQTQHRIFEPFFTTKPEGQGTGLGLATVYGVVKQSGGYIWVYSEPDRGTTFKVYLPRVDQPPEAARGEAVPAGIPRGHETILLAEDTDALREGIRETLESIGYTVLSASNGHQALLLASKHDGPIDLVLTDVVMPKLGGVDLVKLLSPLRPEMRVVYMSGYTDGAISQHGELGEGALLLEKPFTSDTLARVLRDQLDAPAQGR